MFAKPFRVKSQTAIRGSDRKKIRSDVRKAYPSLSEDDLASLFPNKEEMLSMKVYSYTGVNVMVYCLKKNPIFFEIDKVFYPTVYTLWRFPDLLPSMTTHAPVISRLQGGADLMLPGVATDGPVNPETFKHFRKGDRCQINTTDNRAGVAVGLTARSGRDMYHSGMRGKGVQVIHIYKDLLWSQGDQQEPPQLGPSSIFLTDDVDEAEDFDDQVEPYSEEKENSIQNGIDAECGQSEKESANQDIDKFASAVEEAEVGAEFASAIKEAEVGAEFASAIKEAEVSDEFANAIKETEVGADDLVVDAVEQRSDEECADENLQFQETAETMDSLLYQCFMCALLAEVKKVDLPLLTSQLLPMYMMSWCPHGRSLDLKKSSYKKMTKFLHAMVSRKLIVVKQLSKGVDSVTEINRECEEFKLFVLPEKPIQASVVEVTTKPQFHPPKLEELYAVSGNLLPIFMESGLVKGELLDEVEIRKYVTAYVKAHNLTTDANPRLVALDAVLFDAILNKNERLVALDALLFDAILNKNERYITQLQWDQLFTRCMDKMSAVLRITYPGQEPKLVKGRLLSVHLSIARRAGNKRVTLVDNLEQYGIDEATFAHEVQIGVAGSTALQTVPGKKGLQVMVQGNQINYIADLLMGKYGLNKKYITGLDKAPKAKKK